MKLQSLLLPAACAATMLLFVFLATSVQERTVADAYSVEVGLAELSPNGEAGGYAVPASGGSCTGGSLVGSCGDEGSPAPIMGFSFKLIPTAIATGGQAEMEWSWGTNSLPLEHVTVSRCNTPGQNATNCSSWTEIASIAGSAFGAGEKSFSCFLFMTCSQVVPNGTSPQYSAQSAALPSGSYTYRAVARFGTSAYATQIKQLAVGVAKTSTFEVQNATKKSAWTSGTLTIAPGDQIALRWSSTGASNCGGSNFGTGGRTSNPGTQNNNYPKNKSSITEPAEGKSITYGLTCNDGPGTSGVYKEVKVTSSRNASPTPSPSPSSPSVRLEVRNITPGFETPWRRANTFSIVAGHNIELKWSSSNAVSCSGSNFSTGNRTNGTESDISEPGEGDQKSFTVICRSSAGSTREDQITVSASEAVPTLTAEPTIVHKGEEVSLSWDLEGNNPAACSLTGPGAPLIGTEQTGSAHITIDTESTFRLTCEGGEDMVTIHVIPQIFET